jgi:o-succinylbenzoate synthase
MKIVNVQWHSYRLPFLQSFSTAQSILPDREGIIVLVTTDQGIQGVGEIAPLPAFGGESLANACTQLPTLVARIQQKTLQEALDMVLAEGHAGSSTSSVLSGLEIALLDAFGKTKGCAVSTLLAAGGFTPRAAVPVNAIISVRSTEEAFDIAQDARKRGFRCVKLKVGMGLSVQEEIKRIALVRDAIGPALHLRLDANEAWNLDEAISILSRCIPYNIQYVEQPLKAHNLAGMRMLRQMLPIPIAADEAVYSLVSARLVLDCEAADILVIKPQLAGGLRVGQEIIQTAAERGVHSVITSTLEAGIGLLATLHFAAAAPDVTFECGLATLHLLVDDLLVHDLPVRDGFMIVPTGPGLGVDLDWKALNRYCVRSMSYL